MKAATHSVLIMAGGTGGHIFPGLAVAELFQKRGISVRWLGAEGGMECRQVPEAGFEIDSVRISAVRGKGLMAWLTLPFRLTRAVLDARASLVRNQPSCALSFGGYAAGPGGIAARLRGVPLLVHEQNQVPGMTNRVLAKIAQRVLQAFPDTFPEHLQAITRTGAPRLLITGGSQGAHALNNILPESLKLLPEALQPQVCHQTGVADRQETERAYEEAGISAEVHEFIGGMADAYAWADLVICRAGALTVSELSAAGVGAIFVPFPHAVDDHQTLNASYLVGVGAAQLVAEKDLTAQLLAEKLESLFSNRPKLLEMAVAARSLAIPNSAEQVVEACSEWVTS
jgi:UDP-N-acetylglucosamine--N-acetylmuramyl-(pentapeptide) pyrophosphoryl-undecaprenol N-acetylglucosamine transferase